jgi:hypothetical protein
MTGLHAIGDSVCTTNPTLGRGLSVALSTVADLLDTIAKYGEDPIAQALALDELVADHVAPFYEDQASIDAERLAILRHTIFDAPAPDPPPASSDRVTFWQLRGAAPFDPTAFRGVSRIMGMIGQPEEVYTDPQVVQRTQETLRHHASGPPIAQPTREELLAVLAQ